MQEKKRSECDNRFIKHTKQEKIDQKDFCLSMLLSPPVTLSVRQLDCERGIFKSGDPSNNRFKG